MDLSSLGNAIGSPDQVGTVLIPVQENNYELFDIHIEPSECQDSLKNDFLNSAMKDEARMYTLSQIQQLWYLYYNKSTVRDR